ncbi:MAG: DUF1080 domain-containing protein [Phycisphaerae bacterium]|nr:DUF1080 domain-containing protein [Phycisphaerae bacterium]
MNKIKLSIIVLLMLTVGLQAATLDEVLNKFPAQNAQQQAQFASELLATPDVASQLCKRLNSEPGKDVNVRYAINNLACFATKPADKQNFNNALLAALTSQKDKEVQGFIIDQLRWSADSSAIDTIAKYLADDYLNFRAVRTIATIGTDKADNALIGCLAKINDNQRITTINALANMQSTMAIQAVTKYVDSSNKQLQRAALYLLAQTASPAVLPIMEKNDTDMLITYGLNLANQGHIPAAVTIARKLQKNEDFHARTTALTILVQANGTGALDDLYKAFEDHYIVANHAVALAAKIKSDNTLKWWLKKYNAKPDTYTLKAIAAYDAIEKNNTLTQAILSADNSIRETALDLMKYQPNDDIAHVLPVAFSSNLDPQSQSQLIELASVRRIKCFKTVFAACLKMDAKAQPNVLAKLGFLIAKDDLNAIMDYILDENNGKNSAALAKSISKGLDVDIDKKLTADLIAKKLPALSAPSKLIAIDILNAIGGSQAFTLTLEQTKNTDAKITEAAYTAIFDWSDSFALPTLCNILLTSTDEKSQIKALRSIVRLAPNSAMAPAEQIDIYTKALGQLKRPSEKRIILGQLANFPTDASLSIIATLLKDKDLSADACAAAMKTIQPNPKQLVGLTSQIVPAILESLIEFANAEIKKQATTYLDALKSNKVKTVSFDVMAPVGFTRLYNGKNLDNWVGATQNYDPTNGVIVATGGGNIYPDAQYDNFHFKFHFKLNSGDNNGVGIRTKLNVNAAYDGMEIQVLDNTADQYKNLQPYQYHGSIYGVVPAKRGFLNPVGQWNSEEIIADGDHIIIIVNGTIITDAYLHDAAPEGKTMDGNNHPGLFNKSGYIGFLGHGAGPQFREIYIKSL